VNCPVSGLPFYGECNSGSVFYNKIDFPLQYQNALFQCDFDLKWIKYYEFDNAMKLLSVNPFATSTYPIMSIATNPKLGGLFYINYGSQIRRIYYTLNVNNPPQAIAGSDIKFGASPLTVNFSLAGSFDPDNNPISYLWLFDDGDSSSMLNPQHTFIDTSAIPKNLTSNLL
jgi:PKD repeat protein